MVTTSSRCRVPAEWTWSPGTVWRRPWRRGVRRRRGHRALARPGGGDEFFTAAARNLQEAGARAGVRRMVVCPSSGSTASPRATTRRRLGHERAMLAGPIPVRVLRAAQFHEFVAQLVEWGRQGEVSLLPKMRTQLVAARTVAEALAEAGHRPHRRGLQRGHPGDRRPAGGEPRGRGDAARGPARRAGADRGGERPGPPTARCTRRAPCPAGRHPRRPDVRGVAQLHVLIPVAGPALGCARCRAP